MSVLEFMILVEKRYGKYSDEITRKMMHKYITKKFSGEDLDDVFVKLKLNFSTKWRIAPDEAVFEELFPSQNFEMEAILAWNSIKNHSAMDSIICENPIIHLVIESGWRGWPEFVEERENEDQHKWCRNLFIDLYKKFRNKFLEKYEPKVMFGLSDRVNQHNHIGVRLDRIKRVGDVNKCNDLIEIAFNKSQTPSQKLVEDLTENLSLVSTG